ncbi:hypothetical protein [Acinetobacter pseudolwoffii]|uniref:hypothetical protein n=1 Tax=Acinetobacter pseudolwoffii TaxID=2053287 RepID=UPI0021E3FC56|nr:hypothetical protein [Acinetobacter pseudolwoffii]
MANSDIKWFSFDDANAPQLTNTWGCMIDVLDACLVTGFGSIVISSLTISDGVATAVFNSNHSFKQFQVVEISGSSNSEVNKEFKILGLTANTIDFLINIPDQVISGNLSAKLASAGWTKAFSGDQKAVYQAKDKLVNPYFLRVDNALDPVYGATYTKFAKVGILETCGGIDDLSGNQAPYDPSNPNKNWIGVAGASGATSAVSGWMKWKYATGENPSTDSSGSPLAGNREWLIIATSDSFYIFIKQSNGLGFETPYGFGIVKNNNGSYPFLIATNDNSLAGSYINTTSALADPTRTEVCCLYNYAGLLKNNVMFRINSGFNNVRSGNSSNPIMKDPIEGNILSPFYLIDPTNFIMGTLPLVYCCINSADSETRYGMHSDENQAYIAIRYNVTVSRSAIQGFLFFSIYQGEA